MCLITQANVKPCVAQKDIKVIKLMERQEDGSFVTPFQDIPVTLNSTLCAEGNNTVDTYGYNNFRNGITAGFVHAKLRTESAYIDNGIVGVVAYIPKGTEYFVDIYLSEVCANQLLITDELVDIKAFSLTNEEMTDIISPFIEQLIPTDKVTPGWLFTAKKQFAHPLDCKENTDVIGVVSNTDDNGKPSTVFALDEKALDWNDGIEYCKSYKTSGTKTGDWALPNKDVLQNAFEKHITQINLALTIIGKELLNYQYYWASAEYSSAGAWLCSTYYAYLSNASKWGSCYVRPSFAVDV